MQTILLGKLFQPKQLDELKELLLRNLREYPHDDTKRRLLLRDWLRTNWDSFTTNVAAASGDPLVKEGQDIDYWSYSLQYHLEKIVKVQ